MTDCVVRCHVCRDDHNNPKRWRYLCADCAEEKQTQHLRETGHSPELVVVPDEPTIADVRRLARKAFWEVRR